MIRPVLTEVALFLVPFAVYVIFLWATRTRVLDWESWSLPRVSWPPLGDTRADTRGSTGDIPSPPPYAGITRPIGGLS